MNHEQAGANQVPGIGCKRTARITACLLAFAIGGFPCLGGEPSYEGKPLSSWLTNYVFYGDPGNSNFILKNLECSNAVRTIGTNAIPFLLQVLKTKDSALKLKMQELAEKQDFINIPFHSVEEKKPMAQTGFYLLGDLASNAVPALIDISTNAPSAYSKEIADQTLMQLYPASCVATPYWVPPAKRAQWYQAAGVVQFELGARSNAILAFSEALKLEPTNVIACIYRAACKIDLKDFAAAILDCNLVLEQTPTNHDAFFYRGLCRLGMKDFNAAIADFNTTIDLETNDFNAFNYRGLAWANLRKLDQALADLNKSVELSYSNQAESLRNRSMVEGMQKNYELALSDISKSIELDDHDPAAYAARGRIESGLKDYKAALADYDKSMELNPEDLTLYASRASARMYLHDFNGADSDLEMALHINPNNVNALLVRGVVKTERGDSSAVGDLKRAVELAPQVPETYALLGLVQYKTSDWPAALANCRKGLKLGSLGSVADLVSYIWLIQAQSGQETAATAELNEFLRSPQGLKTNEWCGITASFFTGSLPESNFLTLATTSAKRPSAVKSQVCESFYYAGMKRKLASDTNGALAMFQRCLNTKEDLNLAYLNATTELERFKK